MVTILPQVEYPDIITSIVEPSKTYKLDLITGTISHQIDGYEALKQFISKSINTIRFNYLIYSVTDDDDYGCEIKSLFGKGFTDGFIESEIIRMVTEAIIYDDRISNVYDFTVSNIDDGVFVSFSVDTVEGIMSIDEVFR